MTIASNPDAPLVVVVGATGLQGGSVIKHLTDSDRPYRIKGLTRDANKPRAAVLRKEGVEVVSATIAADNGAELQKAFEGADIVFAVTNFWEHMSKDREVAEGKAMIDAAKAAGVKLYIWSGLVSCTNGSGGKYTKVAHFDGKAEITEYLRSSGQKGVDVQAGFYASNLTGLLKPRPAGDGTYNFVTTWPPETKLPLLDTVHDYGLFVRLAIESRQLQQDGEVQAYSEWLTAGQMVEQLSQVTGIKVNYVQLTEDVMREGMMQSGLPPPIVDEILEQNAHFTEFGYYNGKKMPERSGLARQPRTFADFVKAQGDWSKILSA